MRGKGKVKEMTWQWVKTKERLDVFISPEIGNEELEEGKKGALPRALQGSEMKKLLLERHLKRVRSCRPKGKKKK